MLVAVVMSDSGVSFGTVDFSDLDITLPEINNVYPPPPAPPANSIAAPQQTIRSGFLSGLWDVGTAIASAAWDARHDVLDAVGMIPIPLVGELADGLNVVLYAVEGDYANAVVSFGAMVPVIGTAATGGKWAKKGAGAASNLGKNIDNVADALKNRADEIHRVLDTRTQNYRTTAVLKTKEGTTIVGGGGIDLSGKQLQQLKPDEIPAKLKNAHAETTVMDKAKEIGERPDFMGVSRKICEQCQSEITSSGGVIGPDKMTVLWP